MQDAANILLDSLKQEGTRIGFNANLVEASEAALAQVQQ
jgi:imidazole glycerol phosphate synthase subunit HisF